MWSCPRCRRRFANRNQWHSCGMVSVDDHLAAAAPGVVATYEALLRAAKEIGPFELHPVKTRIGLINHMTFAAVWFRRRFLGGHLILDDPPDDQRFERGELPMIHRFRLSAPGDVDHSFCHWLRLAYERGLKHAVVARR